MKRVLQLRHPDCIPNHIREYFNTPENSSREQGTGIQQLEIPPHEHITVIKPLRRTRGQRYRKSELDPWVVDESSSTNDPTSDYTERYIQIPRKKLSLRDRFNSMSKRLRKIASDEGSIKKNDLKLPTTQNITDYLKPIDIHDKNFITMPKFKYLDRFDKIKDEHKKLLKDIDPYKFHLNIEKDLNDKCNDFKFQKPNPNITLEKSIEMNSRLINRLNYDEEPKKYVFSNPFEDSNDEMVVSNKNIKQKLNPYYDINYIRNNIESIASQITYLNYLDCVHKSE